MEKRKMDWDEHEEVQIALISNNANLNYCIA